MRPIGVIAEMHGPVSVSRKPSNGIDSCEGLARIELPESLYQKPTSQAATISTRTSGTRKTSSGS